MRLVGSRALAPGIALAMVLAAFGGLGVVHAQSGSHVVTILGFAFDPNSMTVEVGDSITWDNQDFTSHDVALLSGPESVDLDSGSACGMATGDSYAFFVGAIASGDYTYYCRCHGSQTMSGTFSVTNVAPVVEDFSIEMLEDAVHDGEFRSHDGNGEALNYEIVDAPANGVVQAEGGDAFTYRPDADFNGLDSFTYRADDGELSSGIATVSIEIGAVNDAPAAPDVGFSVDEDGRVTDAVVATDAEGDPLTYRLSSDPTEGALAFNPDGTFTFEPPADFVGQAVFGYVANDGSVDSAEGTVTIEVVQVNDAPVADDLDFSLDEDDPLDGRLTASDVDADALRYQVVTNPGHGTVLVSDAGDFRYEPNADYHGGDSFSYRATDGSLDSNVATVDLTIAPVNDAPVVADVDLETPENTPLSGTVTASDVDGDTLSFALADAPAAGSVDLDSSTGDFTYTPDDGAAGVDSFTVEASDGALVSAPGRISIDVAPVNDPPLVEDVAFSTDEDQALDGLLTASDPEGDAVQFALGDGPTHGILSLDQDGSFTYAPDANFHGTDAFTFTASDGNTESGVATATIEVLPVNDAPVADGVELVTSEDLPLDGTLEGVDIDGDPLTFAIDDAPEHGTVDLDASTGDFTYTPDADFNGLDSFTYRVNDGSVDSAAATAAITIDPVNDAPTAAGASLGTDEDTPLSGALAGSDVDGDDLSYEIVTAPAHGSIELDDSTGSFKYTPGADLNGADAFDYLARDGEAASEVATVTIDVRPVNDPPTAHQASATLDEDTVHQGAATGGDVDGDELSFILDAAPTHGRVTMEADGTYTYTPDPDYFGADSFAFRTDDGELGSAPARVDLDILAINDAPMALDGELSAPLLYPFSRDGQLQATDIEDDPLTFQIVAEPDFGTLDLDPATGKYRYTPTLIPNLSQRDSFTFKVNDGDLDSNVATVQIRVESLW